jgi:hypothetical protein
MHAHHLPEAASTGIKIEFERSGGFMGMRVQATFDTADLPADEAKTLIAMLEESGFYDLPELLEANQPGADQYEYRLAVTRQVDGEPHTHSVTMRDGSAPPALQPLLQRLTRLARGQHQD